jgi:hypothetical protein
VALIITVSEERHVGRYTPDKDMSGRAGTRVIRERNERGFSLFLQNLKGVVQLFLLSDDSTLSMDLFTQDSGLTEVRRRLLDVSGTLTFMEYLIQLDYRDMLCKNHYKIYRNPLSSLQSLYFP